MTKSETYCTQAFDRFFKLSPSSSLESISGLLSGLLHGDCDGKGNTIKSIPSFVTNIITHHLRTSNNLHTISIALSTLDIAVKHNIFSLQNSSSTNYVNIDLSIIKVILQKAMKLHVKNTCYARISPEDIDGSVAKGGIALQVVGTIFRLYPELQTIEEVVSIRQEFTNSMQHCIKSLVEEKIGSDVLLDNISVFFHGYAEYLNAMYYLKEHSSKVNNDTDADADADIDRITKNTDISQLSSIIRHVTQNQYSFLVQNIINIVKAAHAINSFPVHRPLFTSSLQNLDFEKNDNVVISISDIFDNPVVRTKNQGENSYVTVVKNVYNTKKEIIDNNQRKPLQYSADDIENIEKAKYPSSFIFPFGQPNHRDPYKQIFLSQADFATTNQTELQQGIYDVTLDVSTRRPFYQNYQTSHRFVTKTAFDADYTLSLAFLSETAKDNQKSLRSINKNSIRIYEKYDSNKNHLKTNAHEYTATNPHLVDITSIPQLSFRGILKMKNSPSSVSHSTMILRLEHEDGHTTVFNTLMSTSNISGSDDEERRFYANYVFTDGDSVIALSGSGLYKVYIDITYLGDRGAKTISLGHIQLVNMIKPPKDIGYYTIDEREYASGNPLPEDKTHTFATTPRASITKQKVLLSYIFTSFIILGFIGLIMSTTTTTTTKDNKYGNTTMKENSKKNINKKKEKENITHDSTVPTTATITTIPGKRKNRITFVFFVLSLSVLLSSIGVYWFVLNFFQAVVLVSLLCIPLVIATHAVLSDSAARNAMTNSLHPQNIKKNVTGTQKKNN